MQVGLSVIACYVWPALRDPLYYDKLAKLRLRQAAIATTDGPPATVVMFGSSRTLSALDGKSLEEQLSARFGRPTVAFNFGEPAAGPIANYLNLRRLVAAGERPDVVLIEVLPPLMAAQQPLAVEHRFLWAERLWADEVALAVAYGFPAAETRQGWEVSCVVPFYGLRFPIVGRLAPRWRTWTLRFEGSRLTDDAGWLRSELQTVTPEQYRYGLTRMREEYRDKFDGLRFDGAPANALRDSLDFCARQRLQAAVVLMPESSEFRSWYSPAAQAELSELLGRLTQQYAMPLIDARQWLGDESFTDGHHLLPSGAAAFTRRLGNEIPAFTGTAAAARLASEGAAQ
jgi:hypothetical protein